MRPPYAPLLTLLALAAGMASSARRARGTAGEHGEESPGPAAGGDLEQRLERRVSERIHEAERRLMWKLHDKVKRLNFSEEIDWIEGLFEFHEKEFEMLQLNFQRQQRVVEELSRRLTRGEATAARQARQIAALHGTVEKLTAEAAAGNNGAAPGEVTTEVTGSTEDKEDVTVGGKHYPADCESVYQHGGMKYPGHYYLLIQPAGARQPFRAKCDITEKEGWTVIQNRQDGSVDFFRGWDAYKWGFGDVEGEFWIGLEHIHQLTQQGDTRLRIEMTTFKGESFWAEYAHFRVAGENDNYRLHLHGYSGTAGDSLTSRWNNHDGLPFSTHDHDNDHRFYDNCAEKFYGAWWFRSCYDSHLNGKYYAEGSHQDYFQRDGILWNTIHDHASLKTVSMMLRPSDSLVTEDSDEEVEKRRRENHVNSIN